MGAHAFTSLVRPPSSSSPIIFILSLLALSYAGKPAAGQSEAETLLKFKSSLSHNEAIPQWNSMTNPCSGGNISNWFGVICQFGRVWGLKLENMGLGGDIDIDALSQLRELRAINFNKNNFEGPYPNLHLLPKLRLIYLSGNHFSGEIPDKTFSGMIALRRVILSSNAFTGNIPSSLTTLPILVELRLDNNQFQGSIPNFQQKILPYITMANNQLEGPLPPSLSKMDPTLFSGNKGLCGSPLEPCTGAATTPSSRYKSSRKTIIIMLAVLLPLMILAVVIFLLLVCQRKRMARLQRMDSLASYDGSQDEETNTTTRKRSSADGKLDFVRDDRKVFDLSALLTASAEVLESGNFVSAYKVEIFSGQLLVVKRFRLMSRVGRDKFHGHIRRMAKLRHQNLQALVASYYGKEEKLLIFDFVENGTLASHLHGNRTIGLDWQKRLKIIKGVARGLAYLHNELQSLIVPYGFLKSSNVLVDDSYEPLLMDYALQPLINQEHVKDLMVAYKSPEYAQHHHITRKTDVWSLGILILEVLTGKFPTNFLAVGNVKGENLVAWVNEIASAEEEGEDVFDKDIGGTHSGQGEMRKLLNIGFSCCHEDVDVRWSIKEAVEKIEDIKENDEFK